MPEPANHQHTLARSRIVEVIERSREDVLRQLRAAGIPETEALLVMQRFSTFAIQTLRELDLLYREFEQLLASDPDRSQAHQAWLETKAGGMLLTIEAFIAALVAEAIDKAKADYRSELSRPREVIDVSYQPSRLSQIADFFATTHDLVWIAGMVAGFVMAWQFSGSFLVGGIGFLVPFLLWLKLGRFGLALVIPLSGIIGEVCMLIWLYVVEG